MRGTARSDRRRVEWADDDPVSPWETAVRREFGDSPLLEWVEGEGDRSSPHPKARLTRIKDRTSEQVSRRSNAWIVLADWDELDDGRVASLVLDVETEIVLTLCGAGMLFRQGGGDRSNSSMSNTTTRR